MLPYAWCYGYTHFRRKKHFDNSTILLIKLVLKSEKTVRTIHLMELDNKEAWNSLLICELFKLKLWRAFLLAILANSIKSKF